MNSDGWRIPVTDLAYAWWHHPTAFLVRLNSPLSYDKIVARQVLHFEWRSGTSPVSANEISPPSGQQDVVAASQSSPPLGRPAPHEQALQVPFDPSEPAQLHRNRQTLTTAGGNNGTSRASQGLASTAAVSNEMLQASPPVNAKKPERARDHRQTAAPANPRDGQADIMVTSPVTKTLSPKKMTQDKRHHHRVHPS